MKIIDAQREFYTNLFRQHGDSPAALAWRDAETQRERFARLSLAFRRESGPFSVHEIGCGLGHYGRYLQAHFPAATYSGSDVCAEMVDHCRAALPDCAFHLRDVSQQVPAERYDFVTMSGTLYVKLDAAAARWNAFLHDMLDAMYAMAAKGLVVNFLSPYCDEACRQPHLHYQAFGPLLDFVHARLSRHFEIDAAGPLYEYTLRVYRPEYVSAGYRAAAFRRYWPAEERVA